MTDSVHTNLALRAIINYQEQLFPLAHGLKIGSDPSCDIHVAKALPIHAIIAIDGDLIGLYPTERKALIHSVTGVELECLGISENRVFRIADTIFDCVAFRPALLETDERLEKSRRACPRCRTNIATIDLDATYCPHCGGPLPEDCPEWPMLPPEPEPVALVPSRLARWMPRWLRRRVDPLFFGRRTTVLAYMNTLFNLGLRYEAGAEQKRNLPEALRYYRKAAKLQLPARVRMQVKQEKV